MSFSKNVQCYGCGSRAIDKNGICEYCRSIALTPQTINDGFGYIAQEEIYKLTQDRKLDEAQNELKFLIDQFEETRHPSLPQKINNIQVVINNLKGKGKGN